MSVTDAKKAELLLLNNSRDARDSRVEIIKRFIKVEEQPKLSVEVFDHNYLRAFIAGERYYLYLHGNDRLFVTCNDMGGEPPWTA